MANTKGSPAIKGWEEHQLLRDLALGDESPEALAEKYGRALQTVYDFRWKNKHRINAVLAEWSNEFSDLWAVKKHARVADLIADHDSLRERQDELIEDAERATEVMRRVDPDAAPVRVPAREWRALVRDKAKLNHQIAEEMGQLVQHAGALSEQQRGGTDVHGPHAFCQVKAHAKFLALRPDEQTVYRGMPETAQALFLKLTPLQRDWFPLDGSFSEQFEYLQDCTETEFEKRRRLARKQAHEEFWAQWEAEHPPGEYVELFRAGLATSGEFRAQVAAELGGEVPARDSMLSEPVRVQVVQVFAGVDGLCERLAFDDQLRGHIADLIALDWFGDVPVAGEPAPMPADEPETERDEPVELVRMGPPAQDTPEPVAVPAPDVTVPGSNALDPEEPELPPVAPVVEQAARELAIQVWGSIPLPRARLAPAQDQALAHAVHMNCLVRVSGG